MFSLLTEILCSFLQNMMCFSNCFTLGISLVLLNVALSLSNTVLRLLSVTPLPGFFLQLTCMIAKSLTNRYLSKSHNMGHDDHISQEHVSSIGLSYFLQFSMRFPPSPIPSRMIRCVFGCQLPN
uniref:Uncharacterized protein n=1 Tax=Cacopsylla melanoneura TaxID=428564 RepID=A0A8D8ZTI9_9HEMI